MITVNNLIKTYDGFKALDDVSFNIKERGITGLLGPNGAGKTTTMKILTGFLAPTSGSVFIDGLNISTDIQTIKRKIGYLPENNPLYHDMNVYEYLDYMADLKGIKKGEKKEQIKKVVKDCHLTEKLYQDIGKLSKGYRQRVGLAQSLIGDPEILILDEPTVGLDPNQIVEIRELIKKIGQRKIVILSSHILAEVEATCSGVLIIDKGKIVAQGTSAELRNQAAGKTKVNITVESGHGRDIPALLKNIEGVDTVQTLDKFQNEESYQVESLADKDLRKTIIHLLRDNNLELLEISKREMKLEDVFSQLTK